MRSLVQIQVGPREPDASGSLQKPLQARGFLTSEVPVAGYVCTRESANSPRNRSEISKQTFVDSIGLPWDSVPSNFDEIERIGQPPVVS